MYVLCSLTYISIQGITLDTSLLYREHLEKMKQKLKTRNNIYKLAGTTWGANANTLRTSALARLFNSRILLSSLKKQ